MHSLERSEGHGGSLLTRAASGTGRRAKSNFLLSVEGFARLEDAPARFYSRGDLWLPDAPTNLQDEKEGSIRNPNGIGANARPPVGADYTCFTPPLTSLRALRSFKVIFF